MAWNFPLEDQLISEVNSSESQKAGGRCGSSSRVPACKHKVLSSSPRPNKKKKEFSEIFLWGRRVMRRQGR
jgi:hypothetical protein